MISEELKRFIEGFVSKHPGININLTHLNENLTIDNDLGIDDLALDVFLDEFVKEFSIDYSDFNSRKYFGIGIPIIDNNAAFIIKIIGKHSWLPLPKESREKFTLQKLDEAIMLRKLL